MKFFGESGISDLILMGIARVNLTHKAYMRGLKIFIETLKYVQIVAF